MIIFKKTLNNVLFLDIETVSQTKNLSELPQSLQDLWMHKSKKFLPKSMNEMTFEVASNLYAQKAGIFAEFAKIACISVGYLTTYKSLPFTLRIKTFSGEEKELLSSFNDMMNIHYNDPEKHFLCGHNIKEFDIPFICRRNIVNGLSLPTLLSISGKKPWQVNHLLDTMDMWRFGDYKNYTSLALLAGVLGIPTPKDDIDGSMVGHVYWVENNLGRIITYCEKDVLTVAQVAMKFAGQPLIENDHVEFVRD